MADPMLQMEAVSAGYGAGLVLEDVSLSIRAGQTTALLGRNGVGKSSLMLAIMGHLPLRRGRILSRGRDLARLSASARVGAGIAWVPQGRDVFPSLTVEEHLAVASRSGRWTIRAVYGLFPRLRERRTNRGNQLSGGEQQMLAIGRALMSNPALLLLDEPLEGLAPIIVAEVGACIRSLAGTGDIAILLAEQHLAFALGLADEAIVLSGGRESFSGPSLALQSDPTKLDELIGLRRAAEARPVAAT